MEPIVAEIQRFPGIPVNPFHLSGSQSDQLFLACDTHTHTKKKTKKRCRFWNKSLIFECGVLMTTQSASGLEKGVWEGQTPALRKEFSCLSLLAK
jgi:hypothetical protein